MLNRTRRIALVLVGCACLPAACGTKGETADPPPSGPGSGASGSASSPRAGGVGGSSTASGGQSAAQAGAAGEAGAPAGAAAAGEGGASGAAGATGTAGAAGAAAAAGASAGAAGEGGASGATGGAADCEPACNPNGFACCDGSCVAPYNDPRNCGGCGFACPAERPFCDGECTERPCTDQTTCPNGACCGSLCCEAGQLCCVVTLGATRLLCHTPTEAEPTCPPGCPTCDCAAPDTPIATPEGERPIASLRAGDLVYSVDHHAIVAVPLRAVHRQAVEHHHVMRVRLATGAVLQLSPGHPTADGAAFGDLRPGSMLDGVPVVAAELVRYELPYTHDILPDSDTGAYFAAGVLVGSTLARD